MSKKPAQNDAEAGTLPASLLPIERAAAAFSEARANLAREIQELNDQIQELKHQRADKLKAAMRLHNQMEADLRAAVEQVPKTLFEKPRTRQLHGVKVGYTKQPGKLVLQFDDVRTIELIEKHFPDRADVLIRVKRTPNVEALSDLPASDLKRIGGHVAAAGDKLIVTAVNTDIDKLIKALAGDVNLVEDDAA
jgi:erythromycin esterase-like protein